MFGDCGDGLLFHEVHAQFFMVGVETVQKRGAKDIDKFGNSLQITGNAVHES